MRPHEFIRKRLFDTFEKQYAAKIRGFCESYPKTTSYQGDETLEECERMYDDAHARCSAHRRVREAQYPGFLRECADSLPIPPEYRKEADRG